LEVVLFLLYYFPYCLNVLKCSASIKEVITAELSHESHQNFFDGFFVFYTNRSYICNMENNVKLLIIGHARHGKDSLAEILNEHYGLKFISSSQACADIFIYDTLKEKYGYKTPEECYEDRMNRRQEWYEMICDYNKDDKAKLAKEILKYNNTYVGMRDSAEIKECLNQGLFDLVIWVDASKRLPMESSNSFNITPSDADIIVDNNGTYDEFKEKALRLGSLLRR